MDQLPVAHAELRHDEKSVLCGEVWLPSVGRQDMSDGEFVSWAASFEGPIVTWGGSRWAKAANIPPHRLIDLSETFKAATGFQLRLGSFGPEKPSVAETVRELVMRLVRCGRLEWRTRKGVPRGFWVPDFSCPISLLDYAPSPFGE